MEGFAVATGKEVLVLTLNGAVSAASIEREKRPAIKPPHMQRNRKDVTSQRIFIYFLPQMQLKRL